MKEKLRTTFGTVGLILYYLIVSAFTFAPLMAFDWPFWVDTFAIAIVLFVPIVGALAQFALWVWSFFTVIRGPIDIASILYFIAAGLYVLVYIVPVLLSVAQLLFCSKAKKPHFRNKTARSNASMYLQMAQNTIYEAEKSEAISCQTVLMEQIKQIAANSEAEFSSYIPNADMERMAVMSVFNIASSNLSSGQYHIYAGQLNFTGHAMRKVCGYCLGRAHEIGYLDGDAAQEQRLALDRSIADVG